MDLTIQICSKLEIRLKKEFEQTFPEEDRYAVKKILSALVEHENNKNLTKKEDEYFKIEMKSDIRNLSPESRKVFDKLSNSERIALKKTLDDLQGSIFYIQQGCYDPEESECKNGKDEDQMYKSATMKDLDRLTKNVEKI